jgi:hypothetical protein
MFRNMKCTPKTFLPTSDLVWKLVHAASTRWFTQSLAHAHWTTWTLEYVQGKNRCPHTNLSPIATVGETSYTRAFNLRFLCSLLWRGLDLTGRGKIRIAGIYRDNGKRSVSYCVQMGKAPDTTSGEAAILTKELWNSECHLLCATTNHSTVDNKAF